MKRILVFGAGKSSTCLINYLTRICEERGWTLTVGEGDAETLKKKRVPSPAVYPVLIDVEHASERIHLIRNADLVISLLPPRLHILIARDCLEYEKNLLTASYRDDEIIHLSGKIQEKNLLFLYEMGLDPGIDHMSAMQIIEGIRNKGGKITAFRSHTGGLVAPESDDNPWHYKISWNPANVVRAGSAGAIFKENNQIKNITYADLFENTGLVEIKPMGHFAWYPNRDSLAYIPVYGLESAESFIRTTLRHPVFCEGWKHVVRAGLTDDEQVIPSTLGSYADWSKPILPFVNDTNQILYRQLGLFDPDPLPESAHTSAKILQSLLEKNWKMKDSDKDMILMLHEFEYEIGGKKQILNSRLVVKGENAVHTAMAKTVGLPLGIAAKLILEGKMNIRGLHIPIIREIYDPVMAELAGEGIAFQEEFI